MSAEQWRKVDRIFHEALDRKPGDRARFIEEACAGDLSLRNEVEALIAAHERSGSFLESGAAQAVSSPSGSVSAGTRFGPYEILAAIGVGGMGEVYRARDTKLERDVAIKVLPPLFTSDPNRIARFEREARLLATLNHPHIGAIYGSEEANGRRGLVLELVEGETLAERIVRGGSVDLPMPVGEALTIARQIAEAIEAAHEKGIVHRDLKPANIKFTRAGAVKVLDFGIAKAVVGGASVPDLAGSPAATMDGTRDGIILGTAPYMSPEQARGQVVDKRTDIWAFGCVLFEMLTGRPAFAGDTVSDTIARILEREPDWAALPASTPPAVRRVLQRCLEKDPKRRLHDIADARVEIEDVLSGAARTPAPEFVIGRRRWLRQLPWAVAGVATSVAVLLKLRPSPPLLVHRYPLTLPAGQEFDGSVGAHVVALSPDGTQLAYVARPLQLYLGLLSSEEEMKPVPGAEGAKGVREPVFSPDGLSIAFYAFADQTLKKMPVTGGAPVTICPLAVSPRGISWGEDGIVYGQGSRGIWQVSPDPDSTPRQLVSVNDREQAHGPQMLPGGKHVLFTLATGGDRDRWDKAKIIVTSLTSGKHHVIFTGGSDARYIPQTGHIVYAFRGILYAFAFDLQRLEPPKGVPVPIVEGVSRAAGNFTGGANFSVSNDGTLVYALGPAAGPPQALDLALMDRQGKVVTPLNLPPGATYTSPRVSPDGKRVVFGKEGEKEAIVWICALSGPSRMRALTSGGNNRFPMWISNKRVAFQSDREGDLAIWCQPADGGKAERLTTPDQGESHEPESWTDSHGDILLFSVTKGADVSLWTWSLREKKKTPFGSVQSSMPTSAMFSRDGKWVVSASTERETPELTTIWVQPFPDTGPPYQFSGTAPDIPHHPRWSQDGKELFYDPRAGGFDALSFTTEPTFLGNATQLPYLIGMGPPGTRTSYDVTPDGGFVGLIAWGEKKIRFRSINQMRVVINWFEDLKKKVP